MANIFLAWELGGGMGHVVPLSQITRVLVQRGHRVHLAWRDLSGAAAALGPLIDHPAVTLWQAPIWLPQLHGAPQPVSYPELLAHAGYLDAQRLLPLVDAWRHLLQAADTDLLVADHAPTALLASRGQPWRCAQLGTGFFLPPRQSPMPAFREWERVDPARLAASEARVLRSCNEVLARRGQPALGALHALFATDESFALTWPELDHYSPGPQGRPDLTYWGALPGRDEGAPAAWPAGDGARVLVYLKPDYRAVEPVLAQIGRGPWRCLAHVPGLSPAQRQRLAQPGRLVFSEGPVAMQAALRGADAVLCNAGSGTVCAALQAGVPVLMLPMHAEQMLFARRVVAAGAGGLLLEDDAAARLAPTLQRLLAEPLFRARARALAAQHAASHPGDVVERVAERCAQLADRAVGGTAP